MIMNYIMVLNYLFLLCVQFGCIYILSLIFVSNLRIYLSF